MATSPGGPDEEGGLAGLDAYRRLTGVVAHDFNNIFTSILGHLELMRRRSADDPRLLPSINEVERETRRAAALARQLLAAGGPPPSHPAPVASAPGPRPPLREHPRVLVVDDEPTVRRVVSRVLGREGYDVLEAESIGAALAVIRGHELDLIVSDVRLPDGDGFELARAAAGLAPAVRVLLMTGYDAAGAAAPSSPPVLTKPFTPGELIDAVARVLA